MSAPFHVLMLPGSKVPGANSETTAVTNGDAGADRADPQAPPPVDTTAPQGAEASANAAVPTKLPPPPPPEAIIPEDDYLLTRHRHRVSSVQDASNESDNKKSGKTNAAAANSGDNNVDDEDAQKSVPVCTPFEIAIINCCDCGAPKKRKERGRSVSLGQVGEDQATALGIRSTEDNYDGSSSSSPMEEDGSVDGNSSVEYSKVAASSGVSDKSPSSLHVTSQMGHLAEGKEGQFAALIAQHCHTVSDRALALAVLERTMEHDRAMAAEVEAHEKDCPMNTTSGKKRKREEYSASSSSSNEKEIPAVGESAENEDKKAKSSSGTTLSSVDTDNDGENVGVSNDKVKVSRMANFLSAGGLKILTQWLVDSFTPIQKPVAQAPAKKGKDSGNKRKRKKESAEVETVPETSPTGPLILPLLSILQSIPFEYDLIIECKINKHVKKLKKNVERVIGADSSKKSAIEKKLGAMKKECSHPNSGGMPVIEVYRQIGKLMETWMKAMDENKKESKNVDAKSASSRNDVYHSLKATMSQRLETLSSYEAGKAPKPSWLAKLDPKASAGKGKGIDAEEAARQRQMKEKAAASAKAAKEKAEQEKRLLEAKRRKIQLQEELTAENAAIEENKKRLEQYRRRLQEESELRRGVAVETEKTDHKDKAKGRRRRKVTWADQHSDNSTKLAEVREFVRQEDSPSEEDGRRRSESDERSDSTPEEDEYDAYEYDEETQASDSVEEDEFDEDPNLSQEEEEETESAGFTFETKELKR